MPQVQIPFLNPINLMKIDPVIIPQYMSRFMDDYLWSNRLTDPQRSVQRYFQPWQNDDVVTLQFQNNSGQIQVDVINCHQEIFLSFIATQKQQNFYQPDFFIYESNSALTPLPAGLYYFRVRVGVPALETFISEPIWVLDQHEGTILFEYVNRKFYGNIVFETGIKFSIRLFAELKMLPPASKDTLYEDQVLDMVMIQSKPYRIFLLTLKQIPDWMANMMIWILGCSDVKLDGRYFTKNEDAKLTASSPVYFGALIDYTIEMRESTARNSKIYDTVLNTNDQLTITLNVESKGFADTSENASSSVITFIDVE